MAKFETSFMGLVIYENLGRNGKERRVKGKIVQTHLSEQINICHVLKV